MSLVTREGGTLVTFEGTGTLADWQRDCAARWREQGWKESQPWLTTESVAAAKFEHAATGRTLDVQLQCEGAARLTGLINVWNAVGEAAR